MSVTLLFSFENAETAKDPVNIADEAKVLLPEIGDVVESSNGDRHIVSQRLFDWDTDNGPSILLICVRSLPGPEELTLFHDTEEPKGEFFEERLRRLKAQDGVTDGVTEDE